MAHGDGLEAPKRIEDHGRFPHPNAYHVACHVRENRIVAVHAYVLA